jgi:integrase
MTRKPRPPIGNAPRGMRQRLRRDGSWRIWWEPRAEQRTLGFEAVELDAQRLDWSRKEAARLTAQADKARASGVKDQGPRKTGRCMSDLIASYRQTSHFRVTLAAATRDSYAKLLLQIDDKWGAQRVAAFDKATVSAWYETLYEHKSARMAQALIRMLSILFEHGERLGWRPENSNPCLRLRLVTPKPRSRSASWPEVDALLAAADACGLPSIGLAIRLSLFQGQRQTDIMKATRGEFKLMMIAAPGETNGRPEWVWHLTRSKKGNDGILALHSEVIPLLRRVLADPRPDDAALLLDDRIGRAYDTHLFAKRWAEVRALAAQDLPGLAKLHFRDLRRTFGVMARAAGASRADAADVLGNTAATNDVLNATYMPPSYHTAARAISAIKRPEQKKRNEG